MTISVDSSAEQRLAAAERLVSKPSGTRTRFTWEMLLTYLLLSLGAVVMVTPFVWMILTSLKPATELVQFAFLPVNPANVTAPNFSQAAAINAWMLARVTVMM